MAINDFWLTVLKIAFAIATLPAYVWFKERADWSLLIKTRNRSRTVTIVEGTALMLLVLFIILGLPRILVRPVPR